MNIQIKCRFTAKVLFEGDYPSLKFCVEAAAKAGANLAGANLAGANLAGANLAGADLVDAYLAGANLAGADLARANLARAYLAGANLAGANLAGADLVDANLAGADLARADLAGANLARAYLAGAKNAESCRIDTGETLKDYREKVVPELIKAGGKSLVDPAVAASWTCHSWSNCPMHAVFGIDGCEEAPLLLRPRVKQFVQLFDAGWLPAESIPGLGTGAVCDAKMD